MSDKSLSRTLSNISTVPTIFSEGKIKVNPSENKHEIKIPASKSRFNPNNRCQIIPEGVKCDFNPEMYEIEDKCKLEDEHIKYHACRIDRKPFFIKPFLYNYESFDEAEHLKKSIFEKLNTDEILLMDPFFTKQALKKYEEKIIEDEARKEILRILKGSGMLKITQNDLLQIILDHAFSRPGANISFSQNFTESGIYFEDYHESNQMDAASDSSGPNQTEKSERISKTEKTLEQVDEVDELKGDDCNVLKEFEVKVMEGKSVEEKNSMISKQMAESEDLDLDKPFVEGKLEDDNDLISRSKNGLYVYSSDRIPANELFKTESRYIHNAFRGKLYKIFRIGTECHLYESLEQPVEE